MNEYKWNKRFQLRIYTDCKRLDEIYGGENN